MNLQHQDYYHYYHYLPLLWIRIILQVSVFLIELQERTEGGKKWNETMNFIRKMAMKNQDVSWTVPEAKALAVLSPITHCSPFPTTVLTTLQVPRQPEQSSSSPD